MGLVYALGFFFRALASLELAIAIATAGGFHRALEGTMLALTPPRLSRALPTPGLGTLTTLTTLTPGLGTLTTLTPGLRALAALLELAIAITTAGGFHRALEGTMRALTPAGLSRTLPAPRLGALMLPGLGALAALLELAIAIATAGGFHRALEGTMRALTSAGFGTLTSAGFGTLTTLASLELAVAIATAGGFHRALKGTMRALTPAGLRRTLPTPGLLEVLFGRFAEIS